MKPLCITLLLLLGAGSTPAAAQTDDPYDMPLDVQPFWSRYYEAKLEDDEPEMDKNVRTYPDQAVMSLDLLIDDISLSDRPELPSELRTLAWSMDRVEGQTRYIERVRFVLDLSLANRRNRREGMLKLNEAFEVLTEARVERSEDGWARAAAAFEPVLARFESLGDHENVVLCLRQIAETERARGHRWELAVLLKRLLEAADKLAYRETLAEEALGELERLKAEGIDPDGPRPADDGAAPAGETEDAVDGGPGRGLTSYAPGSSDEAHALESVSAKKGVGAIALPSFYPPEQYLVWDTAYLQGVGPGEFRGAGPAEFQPFGVPMMLTREGLTFALDTNGDGTHDIEISPTSTPQLVELPAGDGSRVYPVMISVPSDKESMFGLDVNYSVQPESARLRFNVGGWMEAKVMGETWKVFDSNLTGKFGDEVDAWGDGLTRHSDELPHVWYDADAVLIGNAKVAQPFSPVLPIEDGFYRASITADGTQLTLRQLHLETGQVKLQIDTAVQPTHLLIREMDLLEGALFNVLPPKRNGSVTVPVGTYVLAGGRLEKGKKTSMKQARIYRGRSEAFEVRPGETHVLELGAPYTLDVETRVEGEETIVSARSLRVFGRGGEEYAMLFDDALQPEVEAYTGAGKRVQKAERMRLPDISAWQADGSSMWFPLDMAIETPKGETLVVRLAQKSHVLLGGPLETAEAP